MQRGKRVRRQQVVNCRTARFFRGEARQCDRIRRAPGFAEVAAFLRQRLEAEVRNQLLGSEHPILLQNARCVSTPPSTTRFAPVIQRAASEARKTQASATSSAWPSLPSGAAVLYAATPCGHAS